MSDAGPFIKPYLLSDLTEAELRAIRTRVADGIFLGGNYNDAYREYLTAHTDRKRLLAYVDKLQKLLDQDIRGPDA